MVPEDKIEVNEPEASNVPEERIAVRDPEARTQPDAIRAVNAPEANTHPDACIAPEAIALLSENCAPILRHAEPSQTVI